MWWTDPHCGREWQAAPAEREKGSRLRCPTCDTILDSLGWHFPEIAIEWSPTNPRTAWQVRPSGQTPFLPVWVCQTNPAHTWQATLTCRASGSGCPECLQTGKSKVELDHHAAAVTAFGHAVSGQRRGRWLVDICTTLSDGTPLVIEYDGAYWHATKVDLDTTKTLDLLDTGHLVVRLREHPLAALPIEHDRYTEITVHSTTPNPAEVIARVQQWAHHGRANAAPAG